MQRIAFAVFTTILVLTPTAFAQGQKDFSGVWKMDASRSESAHQAVPIGPYTVVIQQTGTELKVETRRREVGKSAEISETLTYGLDGKERPNTGRDGEPVQVKAHWDGAKLVIESERNMQGASVTTMQVLSLDASGRELTIDKTLNVQHGYQFEGAKTTGRGRDVFVRVKER